MNIFTDNAGNAKQTTVAHFVSLQLQTEVSVLV